MNSNPNKKTSELSISSKDAKQSIDIKSNQLNSEIRKNDSTCSNSDDLITELKQVLEMRNKNKLIQKSIFVYNDV